MFKGYTPFTAVTQYWVHPLCCIRHPGASYTSSLYPPPHQACDPFLTFLCLPFCVPFLAVQLSADILRFTYDDFKRGASNTYVTYLITTEAKRSAQGLSEVLKYEVDVGNESVTHGYYNGKLEPLGSYR